MFLLGRHAILGQEPPIYLRSTIATRLPSPANVHAATVEPVPPPRITRSNSSGCDFLTWANGEVSVPFMRLFLSEHWASRSRLWVHLLVTLPPPPSILLKYLESATYRLRPAKFLAKSS